MYISDIVDAIESIESYIQGYTFDEFLGDKKTRDAVVRNLEIIGEAAGHIDKEIQEDMSNIDWRGMIGLRNFVCHQYFRTDWLIVWETCTQDLKNLIAQLKKD